MSGAFLSRHCNHPSCSWRQETRSKQIYLFTTRRKFPVYGVQRFALTLSGMIKLLCVDVYLKGRVTRHNHLFFSSAWVNTQSWKLQKETKIDDCFAIVCTWKWFVFLVVFFTAFFRKKSCLFWHFKSLFSLCVYHATSCISEDLCLYLGSKTCEDTERTYDWMMGANALPFLSLNEFLDTCSSTSQ